MPTDLRFPAPDGTVFQTRAALICVQDGRFLTCWDRNYPDFLALPGGAIQTGESSEAAARREWYEETGLALESLQLCGVVENFFAWEGRECHEFGFFFRVAVAGSLPPTVLDSPQIEFRWLKLDELSAHLIYPLCLPQLLRVTVGEIGHFVVDQRQP